jgi:hypothetical protein
MESFNQTSQNLPSDPVKETYKNQKYYLKNKKKHLEADKKYKFKLRTLQRLNELNFQVSPDDLKTLVEYRRQNKHTHLKSIIQNNTLNITFLKIEQ